MLPPLVEHLLQRSDISDVLVNNGTDVWAETNGDLVPAGHLDPGEIDASLERILAPIGRRLDRLSPSVDARLGDGTRVCAVIPPISPAGTTVAFRVLRHRRCTIHDFTDDSHLQQSLSDAVTRRANVLVSGATGAGKTTLLAAFIDLVRHSDRIIVLEDTQEIVVSHPHCVRLETRPPTADGIGAVTLDELLRTALRLRPDRLVIGEIRDREAVTMVNALNTGHSGSLSSIHANSAVDAIHRLELLVSRLMPGVDSEVVERLIQGAIDMVVHVERSANGRRTIAHVENLQ